MFGKYGFVDGYNPTLNWFDSDVVGIDVGITLLSAENLLTGDVWHWFMANEAPVRAMDLIGFSEPPGKETAAPIKDPKKQLLKKRTRSASSKAKRAKPTPPPSQA